MQDILVGLVQADTTVGALSSNGQKICRLAHEAASAGASVIVFPELALSGYPPEDLILKKHFLADCRSQLDLIATQLPRDRVVVLGTPHLDGAEVFNAAAILYDGKVAAFYHKICLPNYGVFDEKRVFVPGHKARVLEIGLCRIGIHICEDSWMLDATPCTALEDLALDAVINISASPYHRGKLGLREGAMGKTARLLQTTLLYCNLVGGQDELVFDGASLAVGPDGNLLARAKQFAEGILYFKVPPRGGKRPAADPALVDVIGFPILGKNVPIFSKDWKPVIERALEDPAEVYTALTTGLRDYVEKNGFRKVVVALSGGIDSALVATLAVDALGHERVVGVTMPSQFSSSETLSDAGLLAKNLDIQFFTIPIQHLHETYLQDLSPIWKDRPADITEENIQARIRGNIVMALSNKFGWLVLTTGNKSELATGYCTLYGDMAGGFAVIKDVPKTLVFELARWRNGSTALTAGRQGKPTVIPPSTIERPPSAELRPNQKDTDSLPPYDRLDAILEKYVEGDFPAEAIIAEGFDPATVRRVIRMVDRNEYKRRQGAPGIKITPKAFGRDRRIPITNQYGEGANPGR